jgi:hypothetical protein
MYWYIIPVVAIISVFTFVAVATWAENRRKERESYYRHETYRKIMEQQGDAGKGVLALMREEELQQQRRRLEGLKLGGMITFVVGVGSMVFLYFMVDDEGVYLAGLIPALIGLVMLLYALLMAPRPNGRDGDGAE